jgi:hypothetical protein
MQELMRAVTAWVLTLAFDVWRYPDVVRKDRERRQAEA